MAIDEPISTHLNEKGEIVYPFGVAREPIRQGDIGPIVTWDTNIWAATSTTMSIGNSMFTSNQANSELVRKIGEKLGWDNLLTALEANEVDKWFDNKTLCHYVLYEFKDDIDFKLLKMQSPLTKEGTRPHYLEPIPGGLLTAEAARKWQFMKEDLTWPTVEECNDNSRMEFNLER